MDRHSHLSNIFSMSSCKLIQSSSKHVCLLVNGGGGAQTPTASESSHKAVWASREFTSVNWQEGKWQGVITICVGVGDFIELLYFASVIISLGSCQCDSGAFYVPNPVCQTSKLTHVF